MEELNVDEVKKIQLDILKKIDEFCKFNNLRYYLAYGTLIGAIRHKGYIPWDDDIDIVMPRDDYEKFLEKFNHDRTDTIEVLSPKLDDLYPYAFAKVHDYNTRLVEKVNYKYNIGINVDIFPLDKVKNMKSVIHIYKKGLKYRNIIEVKNVYYTKNVFKNIMKKTLKILFSFININSCTLKLDKLAQMDRDDNSCKYFCVLSSGHKFDPTILNIEWYKEIIQIEFEGCLFNAPKNYDEILKEQFGNYMQLPPVEQQLTHHSFKAYRK